MIGDVEAGLVSTIICKDMSRFGRNYLKVGFFTEILFPEKDVRLIAVYDNLDSERGESDFTTPLVNVFNEWFVRSTSMKIRAVKTSQGKSGQRLAVIPPYGYHKDPNNPKKLIIDEESAAIVRQIFQLSVDGHGPSQIARMMNDSRLLNPSAYKYENEILKKPRPCKDPYFWNTTTIHKILDAPEYLGHTINFKTFSKSYKDSKSRPNDPENMMVFENTHPAIIGEDVWEIVRKMREHKRRAPRYNDPGLFSGVAYCSTCGSKLYFHTQRIRTKAQPEPFLRGSYSCSVYRKRTQYQHKDGQCCTAHYISAPSLEQLVLEELRELLSFVSQHEKQFVRLVMDKSTQEQQRDIVAKRKAIEKHQRRIDELDMLIERLYEDNVIGKVNDERYEKMSAKFEAEQAGLIKTAAALKCETEALETEAVNVDKFLAVVRKYTEIEQLSQAVIHEFIDRIIIHDPEKARGERRQKVEIIYNNIGAVDFLNA
jgi:DNA invertase Pin-like site-specific DNA recombinase